MKKLLKKNKINTFFKCKGTPDEPIGFCGCACCEGVDDYFVNRQIIYDMDN